ncbi:nuclear transport factor 2 family protein [Actinomadura violacea]|uniref:Nuclear transport factor 2 family protein n=1 Tax=Actinomadura violacea TaxID=2819934 RepID=A0ABS3S768_9ACTN|nr:nuclear transport factor 2 family protein [Actinomadura violacea]MBO2464842.1 nuclear transport factor 2 family protein [Actinomadura violacea]
MPETDALQRTAACLAVLAALFAAWAGQNWYTAAHDGAHAYSRTRDAVLQSAEQGVQNLSTLDYRDVDTGLATWLDSTTGDLHQQIAQGRTGFTDQVRKARTVTTAKILDAAVSELDERSGKASVLVAVETTVTPPGGTPVTKQNRLEGRLARTPGGWKLSDLGQAPAGTT